MFLKPFKVKSNNQLKVSDKKHLKEDFKKAFPNMTDQNLDEILPKKDLVSMLKIETSSQMIVQVYVVNKRPIAFIHEGVLFPTIYFLWRYPNIMLTFTTHVPVLSKLIDGAHLMLPGVVHPELTTSSLETPAFSNNTPAYINLTSNQAAVAVGVTAQNSRDMIRSEHRGKCIIVYHVHGDKLCTLDNLPLLPVPDQGLPNWTKQDAAQIENPDEDKKDLHMLDNVETLSLDLSDAADTASCIEATVEPESTVAEMDKLFNDCFLSAIKYSKDLAVPILTSTFYKVHMVAACPAGKTLEVKKSSYKKLSHFLQSMNELGIIKVEEQKKGVDCISEIVREHPMVIKFILDPADRPVRPSKETEQTSQPSVVEAHSVTAKVLPIFSEFGFGKGSVITNSEIRKCVTEYVKKHNLQNPEDKNFIHVNDVLKTIYTGGYSVTWQTFMEKVYNSMTPCYKVTCGDNAVIKKGKLEAINITVAKRSGNKKVTLVDNVEIYGINIDELASACQRGVAASTSINRSETAKKTDQLQIQGNQVLFIYNLLIEKYKVPRKYVKGLEFAPKKKQ